MKRLLFTLVASLVYINSYAEMRKIEQLIQLPTIESLENYSGNSNRIQVTDINRGGIFEYKNINVTIDSGIYFRAKGRGAGVWCRKLDGIKSFNVKLWGAIGNGINDDTKAFQRAQDFIATNRKMLATNVLFIPEGNFVFTRTMFIYGNVSWIGENRFKSKISLKGNYGNGADTLYSIVFGLKRRLVNATWDQASFENLQIKLEKGTNTTTILNLFSVNQVSFKKNFIFLNAADSTGGSSVTGLECRMNSSWCRAASTRDVSIIQNYFTARQSRVGGEGIGLSFTNGFNISDNFVYGFGDDGIAMHRCSNGKVENNRIYVLDGRLYISYGVNIDVLNNYIERIADPKGKWWGGGAFIMTDYETVGAMNYPPNTNINISNNKMVLSSNVPSTTYMIRAIGIQGGQIVNNIAYSNNARVQSSISIEAGYLKGWTGPLGNPDYSAGGVIKPRNLMVANNQSLGSHPGVIRETGALSTLIEGPIKYEGNLSSYSLIGKKSLIAKNSNLRAISPLFKSANLNVTEQVKAIVGSLNIATIGAVLVDDSKDSIHVNPNEDLLLLANADPTNVKVINASKGQIFYLISSNSNTTIFNGMKIKLLAKTNKNLKGTEILRFKVLDSGNVVQEF
jgi:parallel beta-helix repeat protein